MRPRHFISLAILAAGASTMRALPAAAQIEAAAREIDTNRNGLISPAEWQQASFALFRAADKNDNDFIEADELKTSTLAPDTFLRLDTDRDGRLSVDEFMQQRRAIFATADFNQDGAVSLLEFELLTVYEVMGWRDRNEPAQLPVAQLRTVALKLFKLLDQPADGYLDRAEAAYMQPQRFERFDKDKDGRLSPDELAAGYRREFEDPTVRS
jgi:Ca2+-binding EF-hand superfamily protein